MAGGLLNLVAQGNGNCFLMGNPTKTFFKVTYAKHTNFGLQKFRIDYDGLRDLRLNESSTFRFKVPRNADLLMDTYLVMSLPDIWSPIYPPTSDTGFKWAPYEFQWIKDLGTNLISEIEITCGNFTLAKHSGEYIRNMVERDFTRDKKDLFYRMSGNTPELNNPAAVPTRSNAYPSTYFSKSSASVGAEPSIRGRNIYIPINTWFTLNSKMALPLVALQYNEIYISVTLRPISQLFRIRDVFDPTNQYPYVAPDFNLSQFQFTRFLETPPSEQILLTDYTQPLGAWNADIHLLATYCFLSDDEARVFASQPQTYLVKDVTEYNYQNVVESKRVGLGSNGMVSNWMIYFQRNDVNLRNEWSNYSNWPYSNIPYDVLFAPPTSDTVFSFIYTDFKSGNALSTGPMYDPSGNSTNIFISGDFNIANSKDILLTMGIVLDGEYRENTMERGVYDYIEKYTRTSGNAPDGLYCYNFGLNTGQSDNQPSGALNMSKFRTIELEVTTIVPQLDVTASQFNLACDSVGNFIGVNKQNWRLYEYTYNMKVFEERYNVLYFQNGNAGMLYSR